MTIATLAKTATALFLLASDQKSRNVEGFSIVRNTHDERKHAPSSPSSADMITMSRLSPSSKTPRPFPVRSFHHPSSQLSFSTNAKNEESKTPQERFNNSKEEVTPEKVAEMIEVSFLQSCLQLSQGYVDVLKLFIVAVQAGYERRLPLKELIPLVEVCPVNSAGRELMKEEKSLRDEWMLVVYSVLDSLMTRNDVDSSLGGNGKGGDELMLVEDMETTSKKRVRKVVQSVLKIQNQLQTQEIQTGGKQDAIATLSTITVEKAVEMNADLKGMNEEYVDSPMDKAFFMNDVRVALLTCRVVEEEKLCLEGSQGNKKSGSDGNGDVIPRPNIPGTS
mmetsp:Transcript_7045/g.15214  ORF Transcript_7045/g.15214 Transcript_7045/m.15214 type:complete len:335 (+) Transcript_7045:64-1068(+)|eukprot:CAMPEP_0171407734 /NCGR_PEP_ID=MMETSP0880-20121228/20557_1 /TAXON_ID=67004 /ORGANISM="Thalassiosira weissflogii, Strain CCMP1336" /LENGTH=334 /DNA_ID=CAMNT_0011923755 /DNA_START=6 /DNA_END=1010 /DNA_ORIENTATION=-